MLQSNKPPVEGPAIKITTEMVYLVIYKMKAGKTAGPSGIIIEMIKSANNEIIDSITSLFNNIVPNDWHLSYIIHLFKGKVDALSYANYRGLKLQE